MSHAPLAGLLHPALTAPCSPGCTSCHEVDHAAATRELEPMVPFDVAMADLRASYARAATERDEAREMLWRIECLLSDAGLVHENGNGVLDAVRDLIAEARR